MNQNSTSFGGPKQRGVYSEIIIPDSAGGNGVRPILFRPAASSKDLIHHYSSLPSKGKQCQKL